MDGAQNHQTDTEGDWYARKTDGIKAYYEWLPVREPLYQLYRSFEAGDLFNLVILDTRIAGRTRQVDSTGASDYYDENRSILGANQYDWLVENLEGDHTWKLIGNQVPFGQMNIPIEGGSSTPYLDGWDGYPAERNRLIEDIQQKEIDNIVILTGDYHSAFAFETDADATESTQDNVAVEFVVPSINSANTNEYADPVETENERQGYVKHNGHLKYCNLSDHGYILLTVNKSEVRADFVYCETVREPNGNTALDASFLVSSGVPELVPGKR